MLLASLLDLVGSGPSHAVTVQRTMFELVPQLLIHCDHGSTLLWLQLLPQMPHHIFVYLQPHGFNLDVQPAPCNTIIIIQAGL